MQTSNYTLYCYCINMAYQVFGSNDTSIHVKFGRKLSCSLEESANKSCHIILLVVHGRGLKVMHFTQPYIPFTWHSEILENRV